jgi:hypothetical protein
VTNVIVPHEETYYLVTSEMLSSIKEKSVLSDFFFIVTSLAAGAFFSIAITLATSVGLEPTTLAAMETYRSVALGLAIACFAAGVYFLAMTYRKISAVKKSKLIDVQVAPTQELTTDNETV